MGYASNVARITCDAIPQKVESGGAVRVSGVNVETHVFFIFQEKSG
jgi:hypothetical protein